MSSRRLATALSLLAGASTLLSQEPATEPPRFETTVEAITVDVLVLDGTGQPVEGLAEQDFTLLEDGVPQEIGAFQAVTRPAVTVDEDADATRVASNAAPAVPERWLVVVFDEPHLDETQARQAQKALARFLETLSTGDRATIVLAGSGFTWSAGLPRGRSDLLAVLRRARGLRVPETGSDALSDHEAAQIHLHRDQKIMAEVARRYTEKGVMVELMHDGEGAGLYSDLRDADALARVRAADAYARLKARRAQTLEVLVRTLESVASHRGRKSVLLVSSGFLHEPGEAGFARVEDAAQRANAVVYFLDARVLEGPRTQDAEEGVSLDRRDVWTSLNRSVTEVTGAVSVAVETGGERLGSAAGLFDVLQGVADEARSYYLLGYTPKNPARDGRFRKIEVRVGRPDVKVRARRGYRAAPQGPSEPTQADTLAPELRAALASPFGHGDVPIRMGAYVLGPRTGDNVVLAIELDPRAVRPAEGAAAATVETYLVVTDRETGATRRQEVVVEIPEAKRALAGAPWLSLRRSLELPPGSYRATFAAWDRGSGRVGSVVLAFEVAEGFRLATPVLTDSVLAGGSPVLTARRHFTTGARLLFQFEALGATPDPATGRPRIRAGHSLRRTDDGTVLARMEASPLEPGTDGRLARGLAFTPSAPGRYEVDLSVRDDVSSRELEWREAFVVEGQAPAVVAERPGASAGARDYGSIIALYKGGSWSEALSAAAALPARERRDGARAAGRAAEGVMAALALHTELAIAAGIDEAELKTARELLERVPAPARARIEALWHTAVGQRLQAAVRLDDAEQAYGKALKVNPRDAVALAALGSLYELRLSLRHERLGIEAPPAWSQGLPSFEAQSRRAAWERLAEEHYTKALAADATFLEARVRLGRVLHVAGRRVEAARELQAAATAAREPRVATLAALFLGEVLSDDPAQAVGRYRSALGAEPGFQPAAIALANALILQGERREAAEVLRAQLAVPRRDDQLDLWTSYRLGLVSRSAMALLRREAGP
ncbi:MAG TPA: VWA domain-containing protein [Vicinamibacteria bacterium]|nr:VWA domain-containing protein [Vicinamibacteria bacterium]